MISSITVKTDLGWISAFEEKGKIFKVKFGKSKNKSTSKNLKKFKSSLNAFLKRKSKLIQSNFSIKGNHIQKKIWKELQNIKFGKTRTYGQIAKKYKLSPRHVGKICGQNNLLLLVPCHRVVRSDGSLGGFSGLGGINLKKKLLNLEKS